MNSSPKAVRRLRAPRVTVPNREVVKVVTGTEPPVRGVLNKLSVTGGSISLPKFFAEGTVAEVCFETVSGKVRSPIQFLRMRVDGSITTQAFQFIHMPADDKAKLSGVINQLLSKGFGDIKPSRFEPVRQITRRAFQALRFG